MGTIPSVLDVANYIIELSTEIGEPITNMKLQKLLFYSYAWNLVKNNKDRLFNEHIVAWRYGPVIIEAYDAYKKYGAETIREAVDGNVDLLTQMQRNIIEDVYTIYGGKNAIELANLTHSERPWLVAYEEGKNNIISDDIMYEFYSAKEKRVTNLDEKN